MKLLTTLLLLVPASLLLASDKDEPALSYTLRLDKETVRLTPGKAVEIKGRFDNPTATLVPDTERLFTYGQVTFKYPANFAFERLFWLRQHFLRRCRHRERCTQRKAH